MRSERAAPLLLQCLRQSAHHSPFSALVGVVTPSKFSKSYRREQHFFAVSLFGGDKGLKQQQKRDSEKRKRIEKAGLKLIEVPYTWDRGESSLRELLTQHL